ncbi:GAF domain-containing protein [Streptomyces sp. NPDC051105]|uniref:GAF domain-containing protein n=1 Tax=Streptomyces sp. NPDC051105 TaxID=3154843 RepID=UPI003440805B
MTVPAVTAAQSAAFTLLLHDVRRVAGVDLAVGALTAAGADHFVIDRLLGVTTDGLRDLRVSVGAGLGGKAMLLARPVQVQDYCSASGITHDYDAAVRRERIRASFAVPIRVPRGPRGVLWGALRHECAFGDRVIGDVMTVVHALERDLAEELALSRRLENLRAAAGGRSQTAAVRPGTRWRAWPSVVGSSASARNSCTSRPRFRRDPSGSNSTPSSGV